MTLIKSLLLGSAATLVVVAGAQAADLPTKKGAPAAEYVRVCKIDGMAGFVIPGSDTCLKITGYLTGQVTAGSLSTGYAWYGGNGGSNETVLRTLPTENRPDIGYTTRAELEFITKTNTAYGVLTSDIDTQFNYANGFDATEGPGAQFGFINHGFLNWAGITAGKANSFFSAFGGGEGWANLFSPDQMGYNQPLLLAYTATFGGGFSATISLQDPILQGPTGNGVDTWITQNSNYQGLRSPDIVGAIDLVQGWGTAHIAGVAHNVNMAENSTFGTDTLNTWGWAIDGGLKFNLPTFGAGDEISLQGAWSQNAMWHSGIVGGMWDEAWGFGQGGGVNGNGVGMPVADAYSNHDGTWATPTAWTIAASGEFHLGPTFMIAPEIGYGEIHWSGLSYGVLSTNTDSWMGGAVFHWDPVAHMDFALELLYQTTNMSRPAAWTGDIYVNNVLTTGNAWKSTSDGLEGRLMITRDF